MANILGKNFNTMNPFLDITFLTYRLSAVHPVIAKERTTNISSAEIMLKALSNEEISCKKINK